jgi:hypothetical protein
MQMGIMISQSALPTSHICEVMLLDNGEQTSAVTVRTATLTVRETAKVDEKGWFFV